jgi:hypothetical protein
MTFEHSSYTPFHAPLQSAAGPGAHGVPGRNVSRRAGDWRSIARADVHSSAIAMPISKLLEIFAIASAGRPVATTAVHFGHQARWGPGAHLL